MNYCITKDSFHRILIFPTIHFNKCAFSLLQLLLRTCICRLCCCICSFAAPLNCCLCCVWFSSLLSSGQYYLFLKLISDQSILRTISESLKGIMDGNFSPMYLVQLKCHLFSRLVWCCVIHEINFNYRVIWILTFQYIY